MEIRPAAPADREGLVALRFAFLEEFRHIGRDVRERLEPELYRYFDKHIGADDFIAMLGFEDERLCSAAFLTVCDAPPNDQYPNGRLGYVFNVYTLPACRGKGYAGRIMQRLVREAKARGVTAINLNASDAGRPIYERIGFEVLKDTAMRLQIHE